MEITVIYMVIYIIEAFILWQYCSNLFNSRYSKGIECALLLASYTIPFAVSFLENIWINTITFTVVSFVMMLYLYHIKWHSAVFHTMIITTVMGLSEVFVLGIDSHFTRSYSENHAYSSNLVIFIALSKLIYFLVLRFIIRLLKGKKAENMQLDIVTFCFNLIPIMSTFIFCTLCAICLNFNLSLLLARMISASAILLLIINLLSFWFYSYTQEKNHRFIKLQLQLQKEYDAAEYYKMLRQQDENQKILIHDIKKHLQSISALNEQGEQKKITAYIDQLIHSSDLQDSVRVCDNEFLNAILCRYIRSCQKKKIALRADIRKGLLEFLTYDDLTALFCNLLDNAVEAASKIPESYIELSVTYNEKASLTMLTMINSCRKNPFSKQTKKLISSKADSMRHGYGMKSIRRIAEKYDGDMQVYYEEKSTAFHTIITLKETRS